MHIITYTQKENILKGKIKMNIIEALVFSCTQGIILISPDVGKSYTEAFSQSYL